MTLDDQTCVFGSSPKSAGKEARVPCMFDMIAERRLNDAESGGVNGLRDAEYMKQEIANWKAELQKIYDDTLGDDGQRPHPVREHGGVEGV